MLKHIYSILKFTLEEEYDAEKYHFLVQNKQRTEDELVFADLYFGNL